MTTLATVDSGHIEVAAAPVDSGIL